MHAQQTAQHAKRSHTSAAVEKLILSMLSSHLLHASIQALHAGFAFLAVHAAHTGTNPLRHGLVHVT